ncbi:MAG: LapA family protein [Oleiphilaceae bacterium]|nr:LapA family protein [Oleiphilaceae bacterium]
MAKLKLILEILIIIVVLLFAIIFIFRNATTVSVDLLALKIESLQLGWLLILAFIFGGLLGLFARMPSMIGMRMKTKHHERKLQKQEEELKQLRREPAKGS